MNEPTRPAPRRALGSVAMVGSLLQMAARILRSLVGTITVAILARFLSPSDFGAFALIYSLVMFAQVFADLGLRVALVQKAEITELECNSVFWVSTASGVFLTLLVALLADPLSRLFGAPEIAPYVAIVSPMFTIIGLRGVPIALLERQFRFREIATTEFVAAFIGSLTAILFAVNGAGIGALVAQQLAMVVVMALMLFRYSRWLPRLQFSLAALKPIASYGSFVTLSGLLHTASPVIQRPIIGNRLSTADLGLMTMSDQLIGAPVRVIGTSIRKVTFPVLASIQSDNSRVAAAHRNTIHAITIFLAPAVFGIAALAEPVTVLLLGSGWVGLKLLLPIMAPRAMVAVIGELHSAVLSSKGEARFQFVWGAFTLANGVSMLLLTVPYGIEAVALGQLAVSTLVNLPLLTWFLARRLETSAIGLLLPMWRPILVAAIMGVAVYLLDQWMETLGQTLLVRAISGVAAGGAIYLVLMLLVDRRMLMEIWGKVRAARSARKPRA
jgi:O-antigen/teichoic acid export membrane protein